MKCPYCHSLRHDLVIIGRVAATPLPENFATRLGPLLARLAECTSKSLNESASALALRRAPPTLKPMEDALAAYNSEIAALRSEGLTLALSIAGVEQLFTLGFALEQMHQHLGDLERCMQEWAWPSRLDRDR
jgi:chitinase